VETGRRGCGVRAALWSEPRAEGGKCPNFSTTRRPGHVFYNRCASAIANYMKHVVGKIKKKIEAFGRILDFFH
jgi:hypothetical protein